MINLTVTLNFSSMTKSLIQDQNLIRNLEVCENLGKFNNLLLDKSGAITESHMKMKEIWFEDKLMPFS